MNLPLNFVQRVYSQVSAFCAVHCPEEPSLPDSPHHLLQSETLSCEVAFHEILAICLKRYFVCFILFAFPQITLP